MLSIDLSNDTKLTVKIVLKDKALVIEQEPADHVTPTHPAIIPRAQLVIPLSDVKKLVSSLKTLTAFFF